MYLNYKDRHKLIKIKIITTREMRYSFHPNTTRSHRHSYGPATFHTALDSPP